MGKTNASAEIQHEKASPQLLEGYALGEIFMSKYKIEPDEKIRTVEGISL